MADMNENNMFVTFFLGVLDLDSGHLWYCNAGHNAPVRTGPGKAVFLDVVPNLPLGVLPGTQFQEQETDLVEGEGLFLYTDGLTEAEDKEYQLFGEERMLEDLRRTCGKDAETQVKSMVSSVKSHVLGIDPSDDLTILAVRYLNPAPSTGNDRHLSLRNDIGDIPRLHEFMQSITDETGMGHPLAMSLNLALEEAVSNVMLYAYPDGVQGRVEIDAHIREDSFEFILSDSGVPFDPTQAAAPDLELDVAQRPIGGLGIYLVKRIMDSVTYSRIDGKNVLTMIKKR
jgi:sigma-B regulation protein RsbU (phosphoserine phosphatase)